jgi:hypothetical protein
MQPVVAKKPASTTGVFIEELFTFASQLGNHVPLNANLPKFATAFGVWFNSSFAQEFRERRSHRIGKFQYSVGPPVQVCRFLAPIAQNSAFGHIWKYTATAAALFGWG